MIEYITKQQAIDLVKSLEVAIGCLGVSVLTREIERLPVREGRWKGAGMGGYSCSWCMETVAGNRYDYCPNCGAVMDKEE